MRCLPVSLPPTRPAIVSLPSIDSRCPQIDEMLSNVAAEKKTAVLACAKETSALEAVEKAKAQTEASKELLAEQQKQAAEHLAEQLKTVRGSMEGELVKAQKQIAELQDQLAKMEVELMRKVQTPPPPAEPRPVSRDKKDDDKKKKDRNVGGILGNVDFDEDRPLGEQLKEALSKNAVRILDLFREWDTNGDGEVSKKEFRDAMPKLGFHLPAKVINDLFESYDPDGSGVMDLKEVQKMLRGSKPGGADAAAAAAKSAATAAKALGKFKSLKK